MNIRLAGLIVVLLAGAALAASPKVNVDVEEDVYRYEDPGNGSGPFWCFGSSCIVRTGNDVWVSGVEKIAGAKPLNNTRWLLFRRENSGWKCIAKDEKGRTREPSPLGAFADGNLFLSVNPTITPVDVYSGPARPEILRFSSADPAATFETMVPRWEGNPRFTEHSYRSFAVDGARREMILFQNIGYGHAEWSFRDSEGRWSASGKLKWPLGAEYAKPQPIRTCYPSVQLRDRAVYFCGVSDIVEPNEQWRAYKKELTGRDWDYDFRRLFFTWSKDITSGKFEPWVEIASREKTAGWIFPSDLYAGSDGLVHVLWTERAIDTRLRAKFFPGEKQSESLNYATIKDGKLVARRAVILAEEGKSAPLPGRGRFHVTSDGRLFIFYHCMPRGPAGGRVNENWLAEVLPGGTLGDAVRVPLKRPMGVFFTASVRAGCAPSRYLDLLGDFGGRVGYARIRIGE